MKPARIVVLVIALAAGAVAALLAGRPDAPPPPAQAPVAKLDTVDVLVAANDIGIGHTVTAGDMRWQTWPTAAAGSSNFIRKNDRPDAIKQLAGTIARAPLSAGEPVRETKLIRANGSGYMAAVLPSGMRAVSMQITPETGAGGFILPNDHVDVILSRRDREGEKAAGVELHTSETILTNVRVLAIDQTVEEKGGQRVAIGKTATLELSPGQVEMLTRAQQMGTLSLALRSLVDQSKTEPEARDDGRKSGINVVRFGVTTMANPK